ncbi:MAG: DUF4340 domain-containing protein [Candidatus Wallacebacter cryptica]|jgi:hypothetical protein|nr:DUF4340 domain-containing protein [Bacillota bacterium]
MRKRYQWIALSLCLLLLIGVYWYINRPENAGSGSEPVRDLDFWEFEEREIRRLTLQGKQEIVLEQSDDGWQVASLDPELTELAQVNTVVRRFASLEAAFLLEEDPKDLSRYGLDAPNTTVRAELEDGTEHTVYLGNRHPTEYLYYLMREGDKAVYAVNGMYGTAFQSTLENFRSRELGSINLMTLKHLLIRSEGKEPLEIKAVENPAASLQGIDRLRFVSPFKTPKRIASLDNYPDFTLDGSPLLTLRVKDFIELDPKDLSEYGLDQPKGELLVEDSEHKVHLLIGADRSDSEVYAMLAGGTEVFSIYKNLIRIRNADPFDWLIKFLYMASIDDVNQVDITWDDQRYELTMEREEVIVEEDGETKTEKKETFFINGLEAEERSFRRLYGTVIGLTVDARLDHSVEGEPVFKIVYHHNGEDLAPVTVELLPYSRVLYAARIEGVVEFVVAKEKVDKAKSELIAAFEAAKADAAK